MNAATDIFIQRDDILREPALELHLGGRVAIAVVTDIAHIGTIAVARSGKCAN